MFLFDADIVQTQTLPLPDAWRFLPLGYLLTILIETPILVLGLSRKLSPKQRLLCGVWLTACTYPIVVLVLPAIFQGVERWIYLAVAETFAPAAECLLFWMALRGRALFETIDWIRCMAAIIVANLISFGLGEVIGHYGWFGLF
jgi:hypothetical protein